MLKSDLVFSTVKEMFKFASYKRIMRLIKLLSVSLLFLSVTAFSQTTSATIQSKTLPKLYKPQENAEARLTHLVKKAQKEHKNIILQGGGNWCIWCLRFDDFWRSNPEIKKIVDDNYLYYHLNYSPENKNEKLFAKFGNPGQKYGYPVFIVLDENGNQIHTQDSAVLEDGKSYSAEKVKDFFEKWKPKA